MNKRTPWLVVISACLSMIACTTMQPLSADSSLRQTLHRGDKVEVSTNTGQQLQFTVESVDEQGLHGDGQNVVYGDIRSISRKQVSAGRTALVILGVVAVGAAAAGGGGGSGGGY